MSSKTILYIEDNPDIRLLIRLTLAYHDFRILEAADAAQGLQLLRQSRPDLVLLDVMMPGESGLSLMRTINDDPLLRATPVIMISALGLKQDIDAGLHAGARAYLVKPFNPWQLTELIQSLLAAEQAPAPAKLPVA